MKTTLLIIITAIIALLVDFYLYRHIKFRTKRTRWRRAYLIYSIIIDISVVTGLLFYRNVADSHTMFGTRVIMWIVAFFILNTVPKFTYAVFSLGDSLRRRVTHKKSHIFSYIGLVMATFSASVIFYGMTFGRTDIRVEQVELEFDNLPASFDGLRIVQFSDNHLGTVSNRNKFLNRFVDKINGLNPDVIIHSGDLVNNHAWEFDQNAMEVFKRMKSTYGVYSVLGNHDLGMYINDTVKYTPEENVRELERRQRAVGWNVLTNESVFLSNGQDSITISGLNYPDGYQHNGHSSKMTGADIDATYGSIPDSLFNITISHAPQLWNDLLEAGKGDLTMAGHVHAFQLKVTLGKWRWSPAIYMYDHWSGLYEQGGRYMYINDGAGCVMFQMRIGTKPELTLYTLRSKHKE